MRTRHVSKTKGKAISVGKDSLRNMSKICRESLFSHHSETIIAVQCRREGGGGGGGGGGKGVHYPGPRGSKGAPRSLTIFFFFFQLCHLCATTLSSSIEH